MNPIDMLSTKDKEIIINYIRDNVDYRANNIDFLLRFWDANKDVLFKIFGEKLILEEDYVYELSDSDMEEIMLGEVYDKSYPFRTQLRNWCSNYDGVNFLSLTSLDNLIKNRYNGDLFEVYCEDGYHLTIHKGTKLIKVLNSIVNHNPKSFNYDYFEDFRLKHSMALNTRKFYGKMCLSIHPLDYMTMSDNDYEWDSCMSWRNEGDYRQGTVEMMNSPVVIVAYLKGKHDMDIGYGNTWNNKKWRELIIVDKDLITNIKGYPFKSDELSTFCLNWVRELCENFGWNYWDNLSEYHVGRRKHEEYNPYLNISIAPQFNIMYNDYYSSHYVYMNKSLTGLYKYTRCVSGESECMVCGRDTTEDNLSTDLLVCAECADLHRCANCGAYYSDDELFWLNGESYCEDCYEYLDITDCEDCNEVIESSFSVTLVPVDATGKEYRGYQKTICGDCYKEYTGKDIPSDGEIIQARIDSVKEKEKFINYFMLDYEREFIV